MKNFKTLYRLFAGMFILSLFTGCSSTEEVPAEPGLYFELMHPDASTSRVSDLGFEFDDVLGVYVTEAGSPLQLGGNAVNNARMLNKNGTWSAEGTQKWGPGNYDVYAYYPYIPSPESVLEVPFALSADQSSLGTGDEPGGYEASDFLWASAQGVTASATPVKLTFSHRLSRLVVNLVKGEDYEGELDDDAITVRIHNTVADGLLDLSTGYIMKDPYKSARSLTAKPIGNHRFAAIVIPQRIETTVPLVEVIMDGVSYMVSTPFVFKFGMQHTMNVTISKNPEQIKISIGGEMKDWN